MSTKRRTRKNVPAIVPRFLKGAVTIGAIPSLAACGGKSSHQQPVVAAYQGERTPAVVAAYTQPPPPPPSDAQATPPPPPVVAAYQTPPVVAAYVPKPPTAPVRDAGVDAAPPHSKVDPNKKQKKAEVTPGVSGTPDDLPPPPVVAAYVPRDNTPPSPANKPK